MTFEGIRSAIMATISSTWGTKTLIDFPNQPFQQPAKSAWIRPRIKMGDSFIGEIGDNNSGAVGIRVGVLMISIFVPPGTGMKVAGGYANTLETLFRRADIGGVRFQEPSTTDEGIDPDNGFFHLVMSCDLETWVGE